MGNPSCSGGSGDAPDHHDRDVSLRPDSGPVRSRPRTLRHGVHRRDEVLYLEQPLMAWRRTAGSKYNATPKRCRKGLFHHSTLESRRCDELHLMEQGGLISELQAHPQPKFRLEIDGVHITNYLSDFSYQRDGTLVVEDVKGCATEVYRLKKRLMLALLKIEVEEVRW